MKAVFPFGAGLCAALILGVPISAQNEKFPPPSCPASAMGAQEQSSEDPPDSSEVVHAPHPLAEADCDGLGWRAFTAPPFESRKACRDWIRKALNPGDAREFLFPEPRANGGANLRSALPFLI